MESIKLFFPSHARKLFIICVTGFLCYSCATSSNPDIERGATYKYQPGYPEVRFSAVGFLNENNKPSITLAADIIYGSLVFKKDEDKEKAHITIDVRVVNKENDNSAVDSKHYDIKIDKKDAGIINSEEPYIFEKRLEVPAGSYKVYFTVTDQNSRKKITRINDTAIPNPANNKIDLTDIRMLGKDMDTESPHWVPVTTYDIRGKMDSLMFIFQATNNDAQQPLSINAKLSQFNADTTYARPMYYNNYSPSSIQHKGIELDEKTTIKQSQRKLLDEGSVFIEFRFGQQPRGNYRFEVTSTKESADLFKARDFGVKSTNYPALKTARELAAPLIYLMGDKDYEQLMNMTNQDSLKEAIDRFWLKQIGDKNKAVSVLKMYYQRVEEANKQFSNFKEGWKTDPGMMYILFGPPWYVEQHVDQMEWSYAYNREDPERNFFFRQYKLQSKFYPFQHFILQRNQAYYNVEYQQRQLWLSGLILQRSI